MLRTKRHFCTVNESQDDISLERSASCWNKFVYSYKQSILPSSDHPKCIKFFKTTYDLNLEKKKQMFSSHSYIIHPLSKFRLYYELYMVILYLLVLGIKPILVATIHVRLLEKGIVFYHVLEYTKICLEVICLPHVLVTFFTGYINMKDKVIVMEPAKIAKNYLKSLHFYVDLLAFLPRFGRSQDHTIIILLQVWSLIAIIGYVKLFNLKEYIMDVAEYFGFHLKIYFKVFLYACLLFIIIQFLLSFFFATCTFNKEVRGDGRPAFDSWFRHVININVENVSMLYQYAVMLFAVCTLFLNCAYTETMNVAETCTAVTIFAVGKACVVVFTVILVRMILTSNSLELKYLQIIDQLENYMVSKKIPPALKKRVLLYYDYKYQKKYFRESVITELLTEQLRREIMREVLSKLVLNVRLFDLLQPSAVRQVTSYLKPEMFMPNDVIIKDGTVGNCMYFISTGTVAVYTPGGREICHLQDNSYFGEIALIMKEEPRTATVVAVEICETYRLDRKYFKSFFLSNPQVYQHLYKIAEDRIDKIVTLEELFKKSAIK